MIKLEVGNVLLKPSQRKQLMAWLKRSLHLGQRLGGFVATVTIQRIGRAYEARATVQDRVGRFACRSRKHEWRDACRELARMLADRLHQQHLQAVANA